MGIGRPKFRCELVAVGLLTVAACGGKVSDEYSTPIHDAGPVHQGVGSYDSSVTAISDTCNPPLFVGSVGNQVVVVKSDGRGFGFNVPLCNSSVGESPPGFGCSRSDFSSDRPLNSDLTFSNCSARATSYRQVLSFDGEEIDIEVKITFTGFASCPDTAAYPNGDCTSDRVFHFRWLTECLPDANVYEPASCSA